MNIKNRFPNSYELFLDLIASRRIGFFNAGRLSGIGVMGLGSDITIITIYQLLPVCRSDNRDNIVLIFA
jgi:hypothetical protein